MRLSTLLLVAGGVSSLLLQLAAPVSAANPFARLLSNAVQTPAACHFNGLTGTCQSVDSCPGTTPLDDSLCAKDKCCIEQAKFAPGCGRVAIQRGMECQLHNSSGTQ
jgi:hypothetical protein